MIESGLTLNDFSEALRIIASIVSKRYYTDISDYCDYTENEPGEPNVLECKDKMINDTKTIKLI